MWLLLFKLLLLTECVVPFFATLAAAELKILPAVNPHVHDMTTGSSEPVTFSCEAPDLTSTEAGLKWFNDQDEEITATSGSKYTSDFGRKLVLRIPNPTDDDAGTYTCRGLVNGVAEEGSISLELFRVPGKVRITVQATRATKLGLAITPPAEDGGQPVTQYLLKYNKLNNGEEEKSRTIDRVAGEAMTKVELEGLDPHTQYSIKVYAINNVGSGAERQFMERTAD